MMMDEKRGNKFMEDLKKLEVNSLGEFCVCIGILALMIFTYPIFYVFDKVGKNDWN